MSRSSRARSSGTQRQKWPRHGLSLPPTPEPHGQLPGARALPVGSGDGRRKFVMSHPTYPGLTQHRLDTGIEQAKPILDRFTLGLPAPILRSPDIQFPGTGTYLEFARARDGLPHMTGPGPRNKLAGLLMDTVVHLQLEVEAMKSGTSGHQTLGRLTWPVQSRPVMFTSIMGHRVSWRTIDVSLRGRPGRKEKTRPFLQ